MEGRDAKSGQIQEKELLGNHLPVFHTEVLWGRGEDLMWGCLTHLTLVQVLVAGGPRVARLTQAECGARQGVGAALGIPMARLTLTHVFHVTQQACRSGSGEAPGTHLKLPAALLLCFPAALPSPPPASLCPLPHTCAARRAEAGEGAHTVNAGGSRRTGGSNTVVHILLTVCASPAAYTYTVEATGQVLAGTPISAARGTLGFTFVHVFRTIPAYRRVGKKQGL